MRDEIRQFLDQLTRDERYDVFRALLPGIFASITDERSLLDLDNNLVGIFLPVERWLECRPQTFQSRYKTQEESTEAAKDGPSLSEVIARLEAAEAVANSK